MIWSCRKCFLWIVLMAAFLCLLSILIVSVLPMSVVNMRMSYGEQISIDPTRLVLEKCKGCVKPKASTLTPNGTTPKKFIAKTSTSPQLLATELELEHVMESTRGTSISWQEIQSNFARCQKKSVQSNPQCRSVHLDPVSFWRFKGKVPSLDWCFKRMELASSCCAFNHTELMAPSPGDPYPWEKDYLSQGPMTDLKDTAWASLSNLTLLTTGALKLGQEVRFLVQLRTGWGRSRDRGGDVVRLWLVNEHVRASVAAKITDNGNGSYLATVKLPWAGDAVVKATIAYTRELLRSTLFALRLFTSFHWFIGVFKNSSAQEATPCSSLPKLPAFPSLDVCNLTDINGGILWYCGKPGHAELTCRHWVATRKISVPSTMPLNEYEQEWMDLTETKRPFLIPTQLVLKVDDNKTNSTVMEKPKLSCGLRNMSTTFDDVMSTGYFYKGHWLPFSCHLPKVDKSFALNCLKNTTMIILGDSNSRVQIDQLHILTNCVHKIPRGKVTWHAPLRCENDSIGMSIQYFPPKHPFYGSMGEIIGHDKLTSFISKLDSIPKEGRYLIHLHQFLHLVNSHLAIAERRAKQVRSVLVRLLARNPQVLVVIQSVHCAYDNAKLNKHKLNWFLFEMQRSIWKGLGERVMLANTYDMTVAAENHEGHPKFALEFTKLYLGHVCGKWSR